MLPVPVLLIAGGVGVTLVYAAVTGQSVLSEVTAVLTSPSSSRKKRPSRPIGGSRSATTVGQPATTPAAPDVPPSVGRRGPCANMPAPNLVGIGQLWHRLDAGAAAAFSTAEKNAGRQILVTDSFRTFAQQDACHKAKPLTCAAAGGSCHEAGRAVDIVEMKNPAVIGALTAAGWHRWNPQGEPWHWSYGVTG